MPLHVQYNQSQQLQHLSHSFRDYTGPARLLHSQFTDNTTFAALGGHAIASSALTATLLDHPVHDRTPMSQSLPKNTQPSTQTGAEPRTCWLHYEISASLGDTTTQLRQQENHISANTQIQLAACLSARSGDIIADTLAAQLTAIPCIYSHEDVKSLKPGESLALDTQGTLTVHTSIKWSELLCRNFHLFSRWLAQGELLDLSFNASLNANLEVSIEGGYQVIFVRPVDTPHILRLSYVKSTANNTQNTVNACITAKLSNPKAFQVAYTAMVQAIFQRSTEEVDALTAHLPPNTLPNQLLPVATALLKRLGLDKLEELKPRIKEIQQSLETSICTAAQSGVELSFYYHYHRVQAHQALLQLTVRDDALTPALHEAAVTGRLMGQLNKHLKRVNVEQFFNQRVTQQHYTWGFHFNVFSWHAMSREDAKFHVVTQENVYGDVKLAGQGQRCYQDQVGEEKRQFYLDFEAAMPTFKAPDQVSMRDFNLALTLSHSTRQASLSEQAACQLADELAVWGLIPPGEVDTLAGQLYRKLKAQQDIQITLTLTLPCDAFRDLLPTLADANPARLSEALAAALPRHLQMPNCRANPLLRSAFYAPAFAHYLSADESDADTLIELAVTRLRQLRQYDSAHKERNWRRKPGPTLARVMHMHPDLKADLDNLITGMHKLSGHDKLNGNPDVLTAIYHLFDDMGAQHFYMRFFAYYLLLSVTELGYQHTALQATGLIEFGPSTTRQAWLLSGVAPMPHSL
ncbi:hypothetical protein [Pseudoalteromonas rubra]|uniref:hypothetical protein n=1 Tax=Pseudoalteromonas rubra TaxID=43658 RepID=UPI000F78C10D|nr:hypothetical protein [Pseudoalteromonas rubra]